jgi:hypothetical protein
MPISRDQFDQGKAPASWEHTVRAFLNNHPTQAFSVLELAKAVEYPISPITGAYTLHALLHRLASQGKIDERIVRSGRRVETFYATMA